MTKHALLPCVSLELEFQKCYSKVIILISPIFFVYPYIFDTNQKIRKLLQNL